MFVAGLDVQTAFDMAKPSVVSKTFTLLEAHEGREEVLHASRNVRRSFVTHGAAGTAAWRLQFCGEDLPNTHCGKQSGSGRPGKGDRVRT